MPAYLVQFEVCSQGLTVSGTTITRGSTKPEATPTAIVINPTSAQIQGIYGYLGLIKAGQDTSSVETAITALTP